MNYLSTRGQAPLLGFEEVLMRGLAADGGLYVPAQWPHFDARTIRSFATLPYAQVAQAVMRPFIGEVLSQETLAVILSDAAAAFGHSAVAPLQQLGPGHWLLELFHGPTLAFKDIAMQVLARLYEQVLDRSSSRLTIVGATSGDTGSAAIEALHHSEKCTLFILHPKDKISSVQRRQMTCVLAPNVHNIAINGSFDDCQAILKALFNDPSFRQQVNLSGVNSINWARILPQVVYYFVAAVALGAPDRRVSFSVPSGNFGNAFAGFVAKKMGLPIERLVVASNANDILSRAINTGEHRLMKVLPTCAPSMDIQIASNFERLLFEVYRRDGVVMRALMDELARSRSFTIAAKPLALIQQLFATCRCDEPQIMSTIAKTYRTTGQVIDPHTAIGVYAGQQHQRQGVPMISLATAHPAKFAASAHAACGEQCDLPPRLADLHQRQERYQVMDNDTQQVRNYILENYLTAPI